MTPAEACIALNMLPTMGPVRLRKLLQVFETPDRVIVIAGDSTPKSDVLQNCNECDVLIHEAYTQASFEKVSPEWKLYREAFHTSTRELAEIASRAKPHLLGTC